MLGVIPCEYVDEPYIDNKWTTQLWRQIIK